MTPRKHADLIKAWADGAEIQFRSIDGDWIDESEPLWLERGVYRLKPVPKADFVKRGYLNFYSEIVDDINVVVTFDGETGEAKKVEIVK